LPKLSKNFAPFSRAGELRCISLEYELIELAKHLTDIVYHELPSSLKHDQRKELAQKIAIEVIAKAHNMAYTLDFLPPLIEYLLWQEYDILLSRNARERLCQITASNGLTRKHT